MPPLLPSTSSAAAARHVCWVFDLDDTLMPTQEMFRDARVRHIMTRVQQRSSLARDSATDRRKRFVRAYRHIVTADPPLVSAIARLHGTKLLLTNGSRDHAFASLSALRLLPHFHGQLDRDSGIGMKPNPATYEALHRFVLQRHTKKHPPLSFVFFDDLVENLEYPHRLRWTTVWISGPAHAAGNVYVRPSYVDYAFRTIHDAIAFFQA